MMAKVELQIYCLLLFNVFVVADCVNSENKHRTKRKVVFSKSSRFFFRLNGKDNMFNYTEIFAHGWAFRVNFELPESIPKRHQFFKRDVHAELNTIPNELAANTYSCILKYLCETVNNIKISKKCGIFCGIGNIISRTTTMESNFFKSFLNNCDYHTNNCPYLFKDSNIHVG